MAESREPSTPAGALTDAAPSRPPDGREALASTRSWQDEEGSPLPEGATWLDADQAVNFALYSKHAERITLLLYGEDVEAPARTVALDPLRHKSGRLWHVRLTAAELEGLFLYAYRVEGPPPEGRFAWHAFDGDKVLFDPCARGLVFPPGFDRAAAARPGSNAGRAPLGVLCRHRHDAGGVEERPRHESDLILYELHVRGFTRSPSSGVEPGRRGTFAGLVERIPYLRELGVTAVELMPVFQGDPQEGSWWGYMPLSFFAVHRGLASRRYGCAPREEFRETVRALHGAGIEVLLDVVYNHTAESAHDGPTYSYRGIDNSTYYLISGDPLRPYLDFSGTGNTLHCAKRQVRKLILDSMRYWVEEMGVDGFRFDLASLFTRNADGTLNWDDPLALADVLADPRLASVRLIAEPWDAAGAHHLGRSFPGVLWWQWNAAFRDDVRRFLRGDEGMVPALMRRLYGSDDLFPDDRLHASHPYQSVNYVTSHDGFTLYDLFAYERRRNWANGHGNTDGPADEHSWNCGWEGDEGVPAAVLELRKRQAKNACCLLLLANGTPMLRGGDEFLQTQHGNSNPYNQDNATAWLDWDRRRAHADVLRFVRSMIAFRKTHPSLCRSRFWRDDVRWYGQAGPQPDLSPRSRRLAYALRGASQGDADLYVMINGSDEDARFEVQEGSAEDWRRVVDTARPAPDDILDLGHEAPIASRAVPLRARSIVVLLGRSSRGGSSEDAHAHAPGG